DGIVDSCQDCNANGQPDPVEILLGLVGDSDNDMLPDPCEDDCDADGIADSLEIALTPALDFDGDMVLDACQADCNANGKADAVEIIQDMTLDRSRDGRIDACEDCDGDGVTDFAELAGSKSRWVASSGDTLLRELDPRSGIVRRTVPVTAAVNDLAIGVDGRLMIAAGTRVYAFDRVAGVAPVEFSPVLSAEARAIAVAPNGGLAVLLANGRIDILDAAGQVSSTFVQQFAPGDAQDLVFRVGAGVDPVAFVTRSNGVIRRFSWPTAASGTFADLSALAPGLRGAFVLADGSVLVAASALNQILRLDPNGVNLGEWDVESGSLLNGVVAICDAGDGRAVLATAPGSASTINGYNKSTGYTERTYRVYPADAPAPTAIVVAPASGTDSDGNLVPDECESVLGDLNGDGLVNGSDLAILLAAFGPCAGCAADLDGDGQVTAADLAILINAWS
ncbi:MAG: Dockerin type domain, partial [Planctomycetota bacterium]